MGQRRIGGGLLVGGGMVAPWVGQMMGLTVSATVGWLLLGACAVAVFVGLCLLFWPEKALKAEQNDDAAFQLGGKNHTVKGVEMVGFDKPFGIKGSGHSVENLRADRGPDDG
jgi:nitrogen fixation-related uncharacterized protein